MTDKEIIKALECCCSVGLCTECPFENLTSAECGEIMLKEAINLIKRQQEMIDSLIAGQETLQKHFADKMGKILEQLDTQYKQALSDYEDTYNPYYDGQMLAFDIAEQIVKGVRNE